MQEFMQNFHFLRPWILLLLVVPLILYKFFFQKLDSISSWEKVCDKNLLNFLLVKGSSAQRRFVFYLSVTTLLICIVAAAGPSWIKQEVESLAPENPLMVVLNLSSDMAQKDITPNRLARAKFAVADLLSGIPQTQKGLIVYAGEPFLISPITQDTKIITNLLPSVDFNIMPENGDRLDRAIKLAVESLKNGNWSRGQIVILAADVGQDFAKALDSAQDATKDGYQINVISVGANPNEKLRKIADTGQGEYVSVMQIQNLIQHLNNQKEADLKKSSNKVSQWLDEGYYLSFLVLLGCLYFFRRGILIIIFVLGVINEASAGFFLNNAQEGLKAFQSGDYKKASEKFEEPQWQGASQYRLGNYKNAYQNFKRQNDLENLYNQGNALAKMGKIEEAIKIYEDVLSQNPEHEDAKFNLEYLKQQQNQQQSSSQKNEQNEDKQEQQQQSGASAQDSEQDKNQNDSQNNNSENQQKEQNKQDKAQQSPSDEQSQNEEKESSQTQQQNEAQNEQKNQSEPEQRKNQGNTLQKADGDHKYNEEVQARELQYREIPEDAGGLLRAFIAREYAKNRYVKDKE